MRRGKSVLGADLSETIETVQGSISVSDYLVSRCVEAVVHGQDLMEPVSPDPTVASITSTALLHVLSSLSPQLVALAEALPTQQWIDVATGRAYGHRTPGCRRPGHGLVTVQARGYRARP